MRRIVPASAHPQPRPDPKPVWDKPAVTEGPCFGHHHFNGVPGFWRLVKCDNCGYTKERRGAEY